MIEMVSISSVPLCHCACNTSQVHASLLVSPSRYCSLPYPVTRTRPPSSQLQHRQGERTYRLLHSCRSAGLEECGVRHQFGEEAEQQEQGEERQCEIVSSSPLSLVSCQRSYSARIRCHGEGHRESGVANDCCSSSLGGLRHAAGHDDIASASFGRHTQQQQQKKWGRRLLAGVLSTWIVLLHPYISGPAFADIIGGGDAPADGGESLGSSAATESPKAGGLIERLLERTKANKSKYDQERLDNYYKRNYKDYFDFLKGSIINKDKDSLTENELGILRWLEKNK